MNTKMVVFSYVARIFFAENKNAAFFGGVCEVLGSLSSGSEDRGYLPFLLKVYQIKQTRSKEQLLTSVR